VSDRVFDALRRFVAELMRPTLWHGSYEYRVVDVANGKADLQAVRKIKTAFGLIDLPPIDSVPIWSGIPGGGGDPALGSSVLIGFVDGDETRPYVKAVEGESGAGFIPTRAILDASGNVYIGTSATRAHIGGAEPNSVPLAPGRFVRWGDIVVGPTALNQPLTLVPHATNATISKAGT
jgi:hypothetical protein